MLWYSDVLSFVETGCSMTGMVYRHEPMGALPVGHYSLMNLENLNVQEEMSYNYDTMLHVYPTANMDYSVLSGGEKAMLDCSSILWCQNYVSVIFSKTVKWRCVLNRM